MKKYSFDPGNGVFTFGKSLLFLKKLAIIVLGCILYCVIIACIPSYEIGWNCQVVYEDDADSDIQLQAVNGNRYGVRYDGGGNVIPPKSFSMIPFARAKPHRFLIFNIGPMPWIHDKLNEPNKMWREWENIRAEHMLADGELNDLHIEGQYIAEEDGCRFVMNARYQENGETVKIHKEYTFETKFSKITDYGPYELNSFLEYLPEELKQQREKEYEAILYKNHKFIEEGSVLRRHKVFFYLLFTAVSVWLIYLLYRYYRKYNPTYGINFEASGDDPKAEFYYVIPSATMDSSLFGRISNESAEHLVMQHIEMKNAHKALKAYCEEFRDRLPARFEAVYTVGVSGSRYVLKGFCTENGMRRYITDTYYFNFIHYRDTALPPENMRPDLSYGSDIKVSQNIFE